MFSAQNLGRQNSNFDMQLESQGVYEDILIGTGREMGSGDSMVAAIKEKGVCKDSTNLGKQGLNLVGSSLRK